MAFRDLRSQDGLESSGDSENDFSNAFSVSVIDKVFVVRSNVKVDRKSLKTALGKLNEVFTADFFTDAITHLALDFAGKWDMDQTILRDLARCLGPIKQAKKKLHIHFVNATEETQVMIKRQGLDNVFKVIAAGHKSNRPGPAPEPASTNDMKGQIGETSPSPIPAACCSEIIKSVTTLFAVQCSTAISIGAPMQVGSSSDVPRFDIGSTSELSLNALRFTIALCFPRETFLAVSTRMLKRQINDIDEKVASCAAEFLNIALGQAKQGLGEQGYEAQFSIPSINYSVETQSFRAQSVVLPFSSELGGFQLMVGLQARP